MKLFKVSKDQMSIQLDNQTYNRLDTSSLDTTDFNDFIIFKEHKFYKQIK